MVGPPVCVWKVLRETDGERFVAVKKGAFFQENLHANKNEICRNDIYPAIKNFLYVI